MILFDTDFQYHSKIHWFDVTYPDIKYSRYQFAFGFNNFHRFKRYRSKGMLIKGFVNSFLSVLKM